MLLGTLGAILQITAISQVVTDLGDPPAVVPGMAGHPASRHGEKGPLEILFVTITRRHVIRRGGLVAFCR
jgi:hypothetical protein